MLMCVANKQRPEQSTFDRSLVHHLLVCHAHEHWIETGGIERVGDRVHEAVHPTTRRNVNHHAPSDARSKGEVSKDIIVRQQQQAGAGNGYNLHGMTGQKRRKTMAEYYIYQVCE